MWTGRMKRRGDLSEPDITSRAALQDGQASPWPADKNVTLQQLHNVKAGLAMRAERQTGVTINSRS